MGLLLLMILSAATPMPSAARAVEADTITVVTLNLWHDQADWPRRLAKIVAGLRALRPDVVCLQEVLQHRTLANQARTLADSLGCQAHFTSVDSDTSVRRYGNAILTRHPVLHAGGKALDPRDDYRTVAHLRIDFKGRPIDVYDTHLHHTAEGSSIRIAQIRDLLGFIAATRDGGAVVLAGDFNAGPETAEVRLLEAPFLDVYAAANPGAGGEATTTLNPALGHAPRRIDYIFVAREGAPTLTPRSADIILRDPGPDGVWASDHFGVVARFVLGSQARPAPRPARGPGRTKRASGTATSRPH
jgi:endonuclease/exonuclease/phosphatase family metal-dependent hydrolase